MTGKRLRTMLRGAVILAAGMAAPLTVHLAHGQHLPTYGMPVDEQIRQGLRAAPTWQNDVVCRNALLSFPTKHLLLLLRDDPRVQLHCGDLADRSQPPYTVMFDDVSGLQWYETHQGHRQVLGE